MLIKGSVLTKSHMSWDLASAQILSSYVTSGQGLSSLCLSFLICNTGMTILTPSCKAVLRTK